MAHILVGRGARAVERDVDMCSPRRHELLRDGARQQYAVRVEADVDAARRRVTDHVEQMRRKQRLTETLQRQPPEPGHRIDQSQEVLVGQRPLAAADRRRVADEAHAAPKVARAAHFDLEVLGQLGSLCGHGRTLSRPIVDPRPSRTAPEADDGPCRFVAVGYAGCSVRAVLEQGAVWRLATAKLFLSRGVEAASRSTSAFEGGPCTRRTHPSPSTRRPLLARCPAASAWMLSLSATSFACARRASSTWRRSTSSASMSRSSSRPASVTSSPICAPSRSSTPPAYG